MVSLSGQKIKLTVDIQAGKLMAIKPTKTCLNDNNVFSHDKSMTLHSEACFTASTVLILLLLLLLLTTTTTTTTHPLNRLFFQDTWVSWHQKGKPFWILPEQEMMGWQWHQLDHMQIICILLQTDNHASTSPLSFYRPDTHFLQAGYPSAVMGASSEKCL